MKVLCAIAILIAVANSQLVDPDPDPSYVPEGNGGNTGTGGGTSGISGSIKDFSLKNGQRILQGSRGAFLQVMNEIFVTDLIDCTNALLYLYEHLEGAVYTNIFDHFAPLSALERFGFAVHASPLAYRQCLQVYTDLSTTLSSV